MTRYGRAVLVVFGASLAATVIATLVGEKMVGAFLLLPAVGLSALATLGHLVTLDDDALGGWSNPTGAPELWRSSVRELAAKIVVSAAVIVAAVWLFASGG